MDRSLEDGSRVVGAGEKGNALIGVLEHEQRVRYIVKVFAGKAAVSALRKEAKPSPGVYINTDHLRLHSCLMISGCLTFPKAIPKRLPLVVHR